MQCWIPNFSKLTQVLQRRAAAAAAASSSSSASTELLALWLFPWKCCSCSVSVWLLSSVCAVHGARWRWRHVSVRYTPAYTNDRWRRRRLQLEFCSLSVLCLLSIELGSICHCPFWPLDDPLPCGCPKIVTLLVSFLIRFERRQPSPPSSDLSALSFGYVTADLANLFLFFSLFSPTFLLLCFACLFCTLVCILFSFSFSFLFIAFFCCCLFSCLHLMLHVAALIAARVQGVGCRVCRVSVGQVRYLDCLSN